MMMMLMSGEARARPEMNCVVVSRKGFERKTYGRAGPVGKRDLDPLQQLVEEVVEAPEGQDARNDHLQRQSL